MFRFTMKSGQFKLLLVFVCCRVLALVIENMTLRQSLARLQNPSRLSDGYIPEVENAENDSKRVVVITGKMGKWDRKGKPRLRLVQELRFGGDEENEHYLFHFAGPVKADAKGNIYVTRRLDGTIDKFDAAGRYLLTMGKKGKGPGEFSGALDFVIENDSVLSVFDAQTQRITRFSTSGELLTTVSLDMKQVMPPMSFRGIMIDNHGGYVVSYYEPAIKKVVHRFGQDGKYQGSFGEPFDIERPESVLATNLMLNNAAGALALVGNDVLFSQTNPYEIRQYSSNNRLKKKILRKNSFMPPASVKVQGGRYRFRMSTSSTVVGVWRNRIVNCVWIPPFYDDEYGHLDFGTVVDVFDLQGELLTSLTLNEHVRFDYLNDGGKLYGLETSPLRDTRVVKYRLEFADRGQ